jgi:UDP-N-acetylmuramoyl-tripeptide--D-alanyl-D-alanine ligase
MMLTQLGQVTGGSMTGVDVAFDSVSIDTRTLTEGALFVALKGPNFDGHDFLEAAKTKGAAAALVSRNGDHVLPVVKVEDTRLALGKLAAYWRSQFSIPVVGVTGSNGKTTVKEMLTSIFTVACDGVSGDVLATIGNLNNDLGVPLTLLRLRENHRYAVVEMGMNHPGEIGYLTQIARPTIALVTNASAAHLEGLQTVEGVAREKGQIFTGVASDGHAIINRDDRYAALWCELANNLKITGFGLETDAEITADFELYKDHSDVFLRTPWGEAHCRIRVPGRHNVANALAACAAAGAAGVSLSSIARGIEAWQGVAGRMQILTIDGMQVINDAYNANPASFDAALDVLAIQPGIKVLVVGDMGELGEQAASFHREAGEMASAKGIDLCFSIGEQAAQIAKEFADRGFAFSNPEELVAEMKKMLGSAEETPVNILVKGSRAMKMERVISLLQGEGAD